MLTADTLASIRFGVKKLVSHRRDGAQNVCNLDIPVRLVVVDNVVCVIAYVFSTAANPYLRLMRPQFFFFYIDTGLLQVRVDPRAMAPAEISTGEGEM